MTPKEKAEDIMIAFITGTLEVGTLSNKQAKQCALLAVDQLIKEFTYKDSIFWVIQRKKYFESVKYEIQML